jgi:hypothetical protein
MGTCTSADPPAVPSPRLLDDITPRELADELGVSLVTVRSWVRFGRLPRPLQLGQRRYWIRSTLSEFLRNGGPARPSNEQADRGRPVPA